MISPSGIAESQAALATSLKETASEQNGRSFWADAAPLIDGVNSNTQTEQLLDKIIWILSKPEWQGKNVDLVGFSFGGLIIRDLVHHLKETAAFAPVSHILDRINQIVTYDSPNLGSVLGTPSFELEKHVFHPDAVELEDQNATDYRSAGVHIEDALNNTSLVLADFVTDLPDFILANDADAELDVKITGPLLGPYVMDGTVDTWWLPEKKIFMTRNGPDALRNDLQVKRNNGQLLAWRTWPGALATRQMDSYDYPTHLNNDNMRWTTIHGASAGAALTQVIHNVRETVYDACVEGIVKEGLDSQPIDIPYVFVYGIGTPVVTGVVAGDVTVGHTDIDAGVLCEKMIDGFIDDDSHLSKKLKLMDKDWSFRSDIVVEDFSQKGEKKIDPNYNKALNPEFKDKKLSGEANIHIEMPYLSDKRANLSIGKGCDLVAVLAETAGCSVYQKAPAFLKRGVDNTPEPVSLAEEQIDEVQTKPLDFTDDGEFTIGLRYKRVVNEYLNQLNLVYYFSAESEFGPEVTTNDNMVNLMVSNIKGSLYKVEIQRDVSLNENETSPEIELSFSYENGQRWNYMNDWSSSISGEWINNFRVQIVGMDGSTRAGKAPDLRDPASYTTKTVLLASSVERSTENNVSKPSIRVTNMSSKTVREFEVRYYIKSSSQPVVEEYWRNQQEKSTLQLVELDSNYWSINIIYQNVEILPGRSFGQIEFEYHHQGWFPMTYTDDPSYTALGLENVNNNITVHNLAGELLSFRIPEKRFTLSTLQVEAYEASTNPNLSNPIMRVRHTAGDPVTGFVINYQFTALEGVPDVDGWNTEACTKNVSSLGSSNYLFQLTCENQILEPGGVYPAYSTSGTSGLNVALHVGWVTPWNSSDDYSHEGLSASWSHASNIWITDLNGVVLGGTVAP